MLVVMAVAAILLGLIISPLVTTFNFTNRARRTVEVQDAARYAMEVMSREIADAMNVVVADGDYEPFYYYTGGSPNSGDAVVVRGQGYIGAYDDRGTAMQLPYGMVDIVLPHDSLGLEGGGVTQPLVLQYQTVNGTQHPIVVRYFVALTHPDKRLANGNPIWVNNITTRGNRPQNMYTLYRVEFDPYDPHFSNWAVPDSAGGKTPDGKAIWVLNPDFFYGPTVVDGQPQYYWWRKASVAIMPTDSMDLVDFVRPDTTRPYEDPTKPLPSSGANYPYLEARSLVTFTPLITAADPARAVGDSKQPSTYQAEYGHWTGVQNDGTVPFTGYSGDLSSMLPHIVIYHQKRDPDTDATILVPQFDSAVSSTDKYECPANKNRVLAWNSLKGTIEFSIAAPTYDSKHATEKTNASVFDPLNDTPKFTPPPGAYITPASEIVTVEENDGHQVVYSRASSDTKDVYDVPEDIAIVDGAPKQLPPPRTYMVTSAGKVIIGYPYPSESNAIQSQPVPQGHQVTVSFFWQNNQPDDLVKVDYLTRETLSINLTARMYDPVTRNPITTTMANRIRLRNTQR
jgi:hypothetical protein